MSRREPWKSNLGGMAGAAVGAIGGLFALGVVPAISEGDPRLLFNIPTLNVICWVASLLIGWAIGSLFGPLFRRKSDTDRSEIAGGVVAGVVTILIGVTIGWLLWLRAPA
jgi:hypothetical protein